MKYLAVVPLVAVAALAAACSRDAPAAPTSPAEGVRASTSAVSSLDFSGDLDNIPEQVLPGFADRAAAESLRAHLTELKGHLAVGNREAAARELDLARSVLVPGVTDPSDAGYIVMVLDNIDAALARS